MIVILNLLKQMKLYIFFVLVCFTYSLSAESLLKRDTIYNLNGIVFADENNEPLRSVTIRVADSPKGAITNSNGEFSINIEKGFHQLILTMVGRERKIVDVDLQKDSTFLIINLKINSALLDGVEVIAEDPGMRMMRKVIEKKIKQYDSINTYKYTLYTKFVASTDTLTAGRTDNPIDTTIVSIFESYSNGYYEKPDNYYNEIFQRRQSVNIPPQANFLVFGTNVNIYDDFIKFLSEEIYTPFHPSAPDFYEFILDTNFHSDDLPVGGRIIVYPASEQRRLFTGYINIDPEKLIPISVELVPNSVVRLPFNTKLIVKQSFQLVDNNFVMPDKLSINTSSNANIFGIINPRLDISLTTVANNFNINIPIEKNVFNSRRVEASEQADEFDTIFWDKNMIIPLTEIEKQSYEAIRLARETPDSAAGTSIFEQYFSPITRQVAKLNQKPFTGLGDMFIYNRVQGFNLGISVNDEIIKSIEAFGKIAYSFSDEKLNFNLGINYYFDDKKQFKFSSNYYDNLQRSDDPYVIRVPTITWTALLNKSDYGDYYYAKGQELSLSAGFGQLRFIRRDVFERPYLFKIYARREEQSNAKSNADFSFFNRSGQFRENPVITDGLMNTIGFDINWNFNRERRMSNFGFYFGGEFSDPNIIPSDFNFSKYLIMMNLRTKTLPLWQLDVRFSAGLAEGKVPAQKFFSLESSSSFITGNSSFRSMSTKEFYGNRFFAFSFEHNFGEVIPGILRIPGIAEFGIEFILNANIGYSEFSEDALFSDLNGIKIIPQSTESTMDKYYYEFGLGLNRILLFLRADISARFSQFETPKFSFTVTNASF